jgi:hypothetical protein
MKNTEYLDSIHVVGEARDNCLQAMEKYGDNHWWEPDIDPRKFAYHQMLEPILLCYFDTFHGAIELLLGRPVWTHEFGINAKALEQEAERAWKYQIGVTSENERQERVRESIRQLETYCIDHKKPLVSFHLPEEE